MADNAPFYVGSTEDHDILIHPDNAVSLQPKGFAEKNGITAHPDGAIALRNVAPKLRKSLGDSFQGTKRDVTVTQTSEPAPLSVRAGNAIRDAADAAGRGLGRVADYVRGAPQTSQIPEDKLPPVPPGGTQLRTVDNKVVTLPEGYERANPTRLVTGDSRTVNLPAGYENAGENAPRRVFNGAPTVLDAGSKDVVLPPGYQRMGTGSGVEGGGGAGGASGQGGGGAGPAEESLWDKAKGYLPSVRVKTENLPQVRLKTENLPSVGLTPQGRELYEAGKKGALNAVRPLDLVDPLRVRDVVVPAPYNDKFGGGSAGGESGGGGAEVGAARGAEDVEAMRRGLAEGNPQTTVSSAEDSDKAVGDDPLEGIVPQDKGVSKVVEASERGTPERKASPLPARNENANSYEPTQPLPPPRTVDETRQANGISPFASAYPNISGKPSPEVKTPVRPEPKRENLLIGTTQDGQEVVRTASGDTLVVPQGTSKAKGIQTHPDSFGEVQKLPDVLRRNVKSVNQPQVSVTQTSEPGPASLKARNAFVDAADAAQRGVSNIAKAGVKAAVDTVLPPGVSDAARATVEGATQPPDGGVSPDTMSKAGAYAEGIQRKAYGAENLPDLMNIGPNPGDRAFENGKFYIRDLDGKVKVAIGSGPAQAQPGAPTQGAAPAQGQKVKPVIPVGAAQVPGATPPGAVPAPGQSGASVSSARMFVPGVKGDAAPTSETKAQEVERRGKGMADREEQIAQMQSKADQDLANTKERQSQEIARLDAQEMEIRRKANEDAEKMLGDLKAKADEIYNTKTDPYRAFRHTDTGQKIALVAGAFLNGFANAVNPGRNGKDAFEQIMDNDIQAQAKDIKNKESGLNQLMDVFKKHGTLTQNKILAATMLKSKYLEEAARTVEVMGLRSGDPIKVEMAKNKADSLRNQAVALGQAAQEEALKITHGNQQTQLNYQAIQKNKMDLDLQQTMLKQMQNGGGMMGMLPSRSVYGHPVAVPPTVSRDPNAMTELYEKAGKVYTAHQDIKDASDLALKLLEQNKGSLFIGPNDAEVLKEAVGRVLEAQRQSVGQNTVPTGDLMRLLEEVLGKGNNLTPGNYARLVGAWQRVSHQADVDGDSQFEYIGMPKLSVLRANRKDVQYGNTPTAAPAPGN